MPGHSAPIVESPTAGPIWRTRWQDEDETRAFAQRLARGLQTWPGGRDACIALRGDLGAGKTTLVRHLLRAAGVQGRIKSPTYAVVEPHQAGSAEQPWPVWHFDFYRFSDPREWADAGFRDIFAGPGLKLMEWPENAGAQLPAADLKIELAIRSDETRDVILLAGTARGQQWLDALRAD